jgi:hypothetical protein
MPAVLERARRGDRSAPKKSANAAASRPRDAIAIEAMHLLGRWQRVSSRHLAFTMGCACAYGAAVDLRDFDGMILDYLLQKFSATAAMRAFIRKHAGIAAAGSGSLNALLRAIAGAQNPLAAVCSDQLLQAITVSIASLEEQHAR